MPEFIERYLSWKVVATAVCILVFSLGGSAWSEKTEKIRMIENRLDQKVDVKRYEADLFRIEKKLDLLISMHLTVKAKD